ncbi:MAG: DUF418 domain-containing protein [Pseudonocardiales bacterium]|nr:DUF418 domain-containing protein [Pseudonocardiales bacterium]MBV9728809.1 DUF418 domain-containing protein [Pseudonocardiales bacterium]
MTEAVDVRPIGAVAVSARSLAPDLARGTMLLLIALANAPHYRYGPSVHGDGGRMHGYPVFDQVAMLLQITFIKGRAYPMFALLFGYGIVQLLRRHTSSGVEETTVRSIIRRRGWWMVLIGFLHALLLFSGDIIGAYGLLAVVLAEVLIRARDRTLLLVAALWTVPIVLFRTWEGRLSPLGEKASFTTDVVHAAGIRVLEWVQCSVIGSVCTLVPAVLLGVWAARRRLLDEPERHWQFLLRVAVLGVGLAAVGGLPCALVRASWWSPPSEAVTMLASVAQSLTGYAGGVGYAAIAGLVAIRVGVRGEVRGSVRARDRSGVVISALAACGQRSMTCYLLQSVVFVAVLASYGGGLGHRFGLAGIAALATVTWVLSVLLAEGMSRRGYRGPAEVLLRRLTYGPPLAAPRS